MEKAQERQLKWKEFVIKYHSLAIFSYKTFTLLSSRKGFFYRFTLYCLQMCIYLGLVELCIATKMWSNTRKYNILKLDKCIKIMPSSCDEKPLTLKYNEENCLFQTQGKLDTFPHFSLGIKNSKHLVLAT